MAEKITFLYPLDYDWDFKIYKGLKIKNGEVILNLETGEEFLRNGNIITLEDLDKYDPMPEVDIIVVDTADS